jgi:hypothetical protein
MLSTPLRGAQPPSQATAVARLDKRTGPTTPQRRHAEQQRQGPECPRRKTAPPPRCTDSQGRGSTQAARRCLETARVRGGGGGICCPWQRPRGMTTQRTCRAPSQLYSDCNTGGNPASAAPRMLTTRASRGSGAAGLCPRLALTGGSRRESRGGLASTAHAPWPLAVRPFSRLNLATARRSPHTRPTVFLPTHPTVSRVQVISQAQGSSLARREDGVECACGRGRGAAARWGA